MQRKAMLEFATMRPSQRLDLIKKGINAKTGSVKCPTPVGFSLLAPHHPPRPLTIRLCADYGVRAVRGHAELRNDSVSQSPYHSWTDIAHTQDRFPVPRHRKDLVTGCKPTLTEPPIGVATE